MLSQNVIAGVSAYNIGAAGCVSLSELTKI